MSEAAVTPGPRLKVERERRGLSMQKAADDMRLDSWVIDALETDNFERIGPSVYAKGHLRKYAGLLGLPPDEILAAYASLASAPSLSTAPQPGVRMRASTAPVNNFPWVGIAGGVLAVLVLVGIYLWKPWHQRGAGVPPIAMQPAAPSAAASSPQPAASPSEPASGTPAAAPVAATPATASAMPVSARDSAAPIPAVLRTPAAETDTAGSGRARLRLSFSADSWVDVRDKSGHRVFAGFGHANSVKIIAGDAPMRVYLGVVGGVQLQINERAVAIGPQFVTGDVARFEAGADGVLRRDSRVVRPHG